MDNPNGQVGILLAVTRDECLRLRTTRKAVVLNSHRGGGSDKTSSSWLGLLQPEASYEYTRKVDTCVPKLISISGGIRTTYLWVHMSPSTFFALYF